MSRSIESMLRSMSKNRSNVSKRHISKKDCIFSNEMVKDIQKIKASKTTGEVAFIANRLSKEAFYLDGYFNNQLAEIANRQEIFTNLRKSFSSEAVSEYKRAVLSLEEGEADAAAPAADANTASSDEKKDAAGGNKVAEFAKKVWAGIKKIVEKIVSSLIAFGKMLMTRFNEFRAKFSNKLAKEFKAENFKNVDVTIKAIPLPKEIDNVITAIEDSAKKASADAEKVDQAVGKLDEDANLNKIENDIDEIYSTGKNEKPDPKSWACSTVWGTDKRPESKEMKISEYLNCKAGETPKALKLISEEGLKYFVETRNTSEKSLKAAKKYLSELNKSANKIKEKSNKEAVQQYVKANNKIKDAIVYLYQRTYTQFNEQMVMRFQVASAISKGLGKVKESKDDSKK